MWINISEAQFLAFPQFIINALSHLSTWLFLLTLTLNDLLWIVNASLQKSEKFKKAKTTSYSWIFQIYFTLSSFNFLKQNHNFMITFCSLFFFSLSLDDFIPSSSFCSVCLWVRKLIYKFFTLSKFSATDDVCCCWSKLNINKMTGLFPQKHGVLRRKYMKESSNNFFCLNLKFPTLPIFKFSFLLACKIINCLLYSFFVIIVSKI